MNENKTINKSWPTDEINYVSSFPYYFSHMNENELVQVQQTTRFFPRSTDCCHQILITN